MEVVVLSIASSLLVNICVPGPHMDEIFHVKQLEVYLANDFLNWDPKITTLPGLYLFYYVCLKLTFLHKVFGLLHLCRVLNSLLYVPLYVLCTRINKASVELILLFPALFMSSFLYYTDTISLIACLLSLYSRKYNRGLALMVSFFAILCRQTNVVWIGYFAGLEVFKDFKVEGIKDLARVVKGYRRVFEKFYCDLIVALGFLVFLFRNNGIAVGDRESHKPVPHFAQICYLFLIGLLYIPFKNLNIKQFIISPEFILSIPIFAFFINNFSFAHPYLLSDNTHYTFYIWKNIINPFGRLLLPYYALGFSMMNHGKSIEFYWWLLCSSMVLVPAHLLEPRYFITPLAFYLIQHDTQPSLVRKVLLFAINLGTLAIFAFKPYKGISFMW